MTCTLTITADVDDLAGFSNAIHRYLQQRLTLASGMTSNSAVMRWLNARRFPVVISGSTSALLTGKQMSTFSLKLRHTHQHHASVNSNAYSVSNLDLSPSDDCPTPHDHVDDLSGNSATQATDTSGKDTAARI